MTVKGILKVLILGSSILLLGGCSYFHSGPYHPGQEGYYQDGEYYGPEGEYRGPQQKQLKVDRALPKRTKLKENCINGVCGYDCKQSGGRVKCASKPDQRCVVGGSGRIACGYDCKSGHGAVGCGRYKYDNCEVGTNGVRCGNNCYVRDDGQVICGK